MRLFSIPGTGRVEFIGLEWDDRDRIWKAHFRKKWEDGLIKLLSFPVTREGGLTLLEIDGGQLEVPELACPELDAATSRFIV